ncbi:hypothetical protein P7K49_029938, partial [Saguinus oedipus]
MTQGIFPFACKAGPQSVIEGFTMPPPNVLWLISYINSSETAKQTPDSFQHLPPHSILFSVSCIISIDFDIFLLEEESEESPWLPTYH